MGFLLGNFNVREVGRPPKVGTLYEMGKAVRGGFSGPAKIANTLRGCCGEAPIRKNGVAIKRRSSL